MGYDSREEEDANSANIRMEEGTRSSVSVKATKDSGLLHALDKWEEAQVWCLRKI
jgi:hypothetical protein